MLEISRLLEVLDYDPETGDLTWKTDVAYNVRAGDIAGKSKNGRYQKIVFGRKTYLAHRVAWALAHGRWPIQCLDHVNGNPHDNRLCNLREASPRQNCFNRRRQSGTKSGLKGVYYRPKQRLWEASIMSGGVYRYLGQYQTPEEAHAAYVTAAQQLHGEFARAA
jgi:hypothetical protein